MNAYIIYTQSKGGAQTDGKAKTFWGREVYNRKKDVTLGFRDTHYITSKFHLLSEFHYSQRKDGTDNIYRFQKAVFLQHLFPLVIKTPELARICVLFARWHIITMQQKIISIHRFYNL